MALIRCRLPLTTNTNSTSTEIGQSERFGFGLGTLADESCTRLIPARLRTGNDSTISRIPLGAAGSGVALERKQERSPPLCRTGMRWRMVLGRLTEPQTDWPRMR